MKCHRLATCLTLFWFLPFACADGNDAPRGDAGAPSDTSGPEASPDATDEHRVDAPAVGPCSAGGFCYSDLPVHMPLEGVTATNIDDAWATSDGMILRWNGSTWQSTYEHTGASGKIDFHNIHTTKADDVWAPAIDDRGHAFIVRYSKTDGDVPTFREVPTEEVIGDGFVSWMAATWLTPASDALWGPMSNGTVLRFREDPADSHLIVDRWVPRMGPADTASYNWSAIWGFAPDDIYIGGTICSPPFPGEPAMPGFCNASQTVLGHFDGTDFTLTLLELGTQIDTMFGTPPGQPRQLWLTYGTSMGGPATLALVPVMADDHLGAPLFSHLLPAFGRAFGSVISPNAAWISNGNLVWRWTGSALEVVPTSRGGLPVGVVRGLWAGSMEDAWIVGQAVAQGPGFPPTGFAAQHRTGGIGAEP